MNDPRSHIAPPADGFVAAWSDGRHGEQLRLSWENEAWTAVGTVESAQVEYVLRVTAQWRVSQFLLFRDLDEADLWLGTDGQGRWGEVNGAHRPDLDGAIDLSLAVTPFTHTIPIRRLPLHVGDGVDLPVVEVDVETLGAVTNQVRYERTADRSWRHHRGTDIVEFTVDEYGIPSDVGPFTRTA